MMVDVILIVLVLLLGGVLGLVVEFLKYLYPICLALALLLAVAFLALLEELMKWTAKQER